MHSVWKSFSDQKNIEVKQLFYRLVGNDQSLLYLAFPKNRVPCKSLLRVQIKQGIVWFFGYKVGFPNGCTSLKKTKKQEMVFSTIEQTNLLKLSSEKQPFLLLI